MNVTTACLIEVRVHQRGHDRIIQNAQAVHLVPVALLWRRRAWGQVAGRARIPVLVLRRGSLRRWSPVRLLPRHPPDSAWARYRSVVRQAYAPAMVARRRREVIWFRHELRAGVVKACCLRRVVVRIRRLARELRGHRRLADDATAA